MSLAAVLLLVGLSVLAMVAFFGLAAAEVPSAARQFRDQPPPGWRLFWPLIRFLAYWCARHLAVGHRQMLERQLARAGLERALSAEEFMAGRLACALAMTALLVLAACLHGATPRLLAPGLALVYLGWCWPQLRLREQIKRRQRAVTRLLPFYGELLILGVEAGLNLQAALAQAVTQGPVGPLRDEFERVLRDIRTGRARSDSLKAMALRLDLASVTSLVAALLTAESQGASLGPVLRAQIEQRRNERFQLAEKLAMQAPVKMLLPLVVFIFPCTFLIVVFPIVHRFLHEGWLR